MSPNNTFDLQTVSFIQMNLNLVLYKELSWDPEIRFLHLFINDRNMTVIVVKSSKERRQNIDSLKVLVQDWFWVMTSPDSLNTVGMVC